MIIFENLSWQTRSDKPNEDWTGQAKYVVPDGSSLALKILSCVNGFTPIEDENGELIDIEAVEVVDIRTKDDIIVDIKAAETAQQRSQTAILAAQLVGDTPPEKDVTYFMQYEATKASLRAELAELEAEKETLRSKLAGIESEEGK